MRRKLFNLATAISLVLWVAVCVLWVRSYYRTDIVSRFWTYRHVSVSSGKGLFSVVASRRPVGGPSYSIFVARGTIWTTHDPFDVWAGIPSDHQWKLIGFAYDYFPNARGTYGWEQWDYGLHYWFLFVVCAALPIVIGSKRVLLRRRARHGFCAKCGYDLRATPKRCPECGRLSDSAAR